MKYDCVRLPFLLLLVGILLLTGCDAFDGQYVRVTPHTIQSSKTSSELQEAQSYLDLRNILYGKRRDRHQELSGGRPEEGHGEGRAIHLQF